MIERINELSLVDMFTGIIEEIGVIQSVLRKGEFYTLKIQAHKVLEQTNIGDSVAINGVCLTVTSIDSLGSFHCDVMRETIHRTSLKNIQSGMKVNLERALTLQTRLGGHLVSGHVDEVATIIKKENHSNSIIFSIKVSRDLLKYIAPKGSVALDGISLTVVDTINDSFSVSIIPHTMLNTLLMYKALGDQINVEVDVLSRYVVNYIEKNDSRAVVDWEKIAKVGI